MFLLMFTERSYWHKEHDYFDIPIFDIEMPNCKTQHINLPQHIEMPNCISMNETLKLPEEELFKREKELDETLKI